MMMMGSIDYIDSYQNVSLPHIEMIVKDHSFAAGTNLLTGTWGDDSGFSIQLVNQAGFDPVIDNIAFTIVPEPATLLLITAGALALRRRRK